MSRYHHVNAMKAERFSVKAACDAAEVSTSAYYEWKNKGSKGPSAQQRSEAILLSEIREIHAGINESYGSPRMTRELRRRGRRVNRKRVERLMHHHDIVGVTPRRRVRSTIHGEDAPPFPDLVERRFAPGAPDFAWCGDITYIPTDEGWLYLSSVLDLGSRHLVGWQMDEHMATSLVANALRQAVELRGSARGVIFHSDRGSQTSRSALPGSLHLVRHPPVRGTRGDVPIYNSIAESFWSSLKRELVHRYRFSTRAQAKTAINIWIKRYNAVRLHSSLDYVPPIEWELNYRRQQQQAA